MSWDSPLLAQFPPRTLDLPYEKQPSPYFTAGGLEQGIKFEGAGVGNDFEEMGYVHTGISALGNLPNHDNTPRHSNPIISNPFHNLSTFSTTFSIPTTTSSFPFGLSPSDMQSTPLSAPLQGSTEIYIPPDGSLSAFSNPAAKGEGSWFAAMQDSYLQHHSTAPPSNYLSPLRTRRSPENHSHLHRSPGQNYSPVSSPRMTPPHSSYGTSPMKSTGLERRGSIVTALASPTRDLSTGGSTTGAGMSVRRPSRLSISVPAAMNLYVSQSLFIERH